jgi:manganese efflux pump family protein
MWQAIALSLGLAMDATAVSAARGLGKHNARDLVVLPLLFGGFQSGMAALGWLAGAFAGRYIAAYDHWVAFGLLLLIGGKMIVEAVRGGDDEPVQPASAMLYIGLALATSIDAAAAGITLPLVPVAPWLALVLIGGITAACSAAGYLAGRAVGHKLGSSLEVLGGVVLIAIGINMLIQAA